LNGVVIKSKHLPVSAANFFKAVGITVCEPASWHLSGPNQRNLIIAAFVICLFLPNTWEWINAKIGKKTSLFSAALIAVMFVVAVLYMGRVTEFIYFQF
jgi:hypothetical protein